MNYDAIVIGGGIIGACASYFLSKENQKVLLIEKNFIGRGASGSSAAMLECQIDAHRGDPFFSLALASHKLFPSLYLEIKESTGLDFQYDPCGILQLALIEEDSLFLKSSVADLQKKGLKAEWKETDQIQSEYPYLNSDHVGGAFFWEDGQINGEKFLSAMIKASKKNGVDVLSEQKDVMWDVRNGKVEGIKTPQKTYCAGKYVVAAGAWTDSLLEPLQTKLGIYPVKGQMLVYETPNIPLKHPIYTRSSGYVTPKKDGYTFVGATVEKVGFSEESFTKEQTQLKSYADNIFPGLLKKTFRGVVSGFRPGSPDDLPVIGPLVDHPQIIVASGHYRNGILLAPITGQAVTDLALGKKPAFDILPFSPSRFQAN